MANQAMDRSTTPLTPSSALCRFSAEVLGSDNVVPVVLEFHQPPVAVYRQANPAADIVKYQEDLSHQHRQFLDQLVSLGVNVQLGSSRVVEATPEGRREVTIPHDFTYVFNGIGVLMPGRNVTNVSQMSDVRAVTFNRERVYLNLDKSVPYTGATKLWERKDAAGLAIRGEGVSVAVIDTGIDWTHPAFGGFTYAPNDKVVYAASYTGEFPQDNFGHGSHVAGIVAGDGDYKGTPRGDSQISGMAPKARLMGYKVLTAAGSGSATNIILAMEDAVRRGAHVMNLSLGDTQGDPGSPECSAANNAMLAGVAVCIAAGNAGPEAETIGAPGAAHHVITVGASTDDGVTALTAELLLSAPGPRSVEMRLLEGSQVLPSPAMELAFVKCAKGLGPSDFPAAVKGRIALVQRGDITFVEKATNAQNAGALACLIYNNRDGNFFGTLGDGPFPSIPAVSISKADGEFMIGLTDAKTGLSNVTMRLNPEAVPQPDRLAEFSSRGPNHDLWLKPELTAPGVNIRSATITSAPLPGGGMPDPSGYAIASGTSMATPHVAGACALLRQAHPDWTPLQMKAALVNSARLMSGQGGVMDQGNGAIDLVKAADCRAILVAATDPISPTHSFGVVVNNGAQVTSTQSLTVHPLSTEPDKSMYTLTVTLAGEPVGLKAELSFGSLDSGKGSGASFDLTITADGAVVADGAYYGWVLAAADWGTLRLPFYYVASRQPAAAPPKPSSAPDTAAPPDRKRVGAVPCI